MNRVALMLVALAGFAIPPSLTLASDLPWKHSWAEATTAAKPRDAIIMVDVYTDWCRWCKVLDAQTFGDSRVQKELGDLVLLKLNAEKGEGIAFNTKHGVRSYPTVLFLDAAGQEVERLTGFVNAEVFLTRLAEIKSGEGTLLALRAKEKAAPTDGLNLKKLGDKFVGRSENETARSYYARALELDPDNKLGYISEIYLNLARMSLAERKNDDARKQLEKVIELGDNSLALKQAYPALRRLYLVAQDNAAISPMHDHVLGVLKDDPAVLNDIAWHHASRSERLDEALKWATRSVALDPEKATSYDTLAEVHHRRGEHDDAIRSIDLALKISPESAYFSKQKQRFTEAVGRTNG